MKKGAYYVFRFLVWLTGALSRKNLYRLSTIVRIIIGDLIGYRKKTILSNLQKSFPKKSDAEINQLTKQYYQNLCDIILETLASYTHTEAFMNEKMFSFENLDLLSTLRHKHPKIIGVAGHIGNFEIGAISLPKQLDLTCFSVYKPLANPFINEYIHAQRVRTGLELVPIKQLRELMPNMQASSILFLVCDQNPTKIESADWVHFLHRDTAFISGPARLAKEHNAPMVYIHILRTGRGRYTGRFDLITEDPQGYNQQELSQQVANALEKNILESPDDWLWSHKRWKWVRDGSLVKRIVS
jgi:Kdo2-lipid IVA lauroyltransferase/acyltransferase